MSFRWEWDGGASDAFASQPEAEGWIGAEWRALLDGGVEHVRLVDDGAEVYSMALTED